MAENVKKPRVIVSLTSFPGAVEYVPQVVNSILKGTTLPDKIVLYVTRQQFEGQEMPESLVELAQANPIFEIRAYDSPIRSYTKLIPALKDFPDDIIVTVDDDVRYHPAMLGELLKWHHKFPDDVIAHRAKRIYADRPYRKWPKYRWYHFLKRRVYRRFDTMQTGVGGALYPPHALKPEMLDESLFTALAPTADDIWFWAATVLNGRKVIPVPFGLNKPRGVGKPRELTLKAHNFKSGTDRNRMQFDAIAEKYPEIKSFLKE